MLCVLARSGLDQLTCKTLWKANTFPLNVSARIAPALKRGGIVNKVDTNLFQNRLGVGLDNGQRFFVEHFEVWNISFDILGCFKRNGTALSAASRTAAPCATSTSTYCCLGHWAILDSVTKEKICFYIACSASALRRFYAPWQEKATLLTDVHAASLVARLGS